jgi:hypothetical protein
LENCRFKSGNFQQKAGQAVIFGRLSMNIRGLTGTIFGYESSGDRNISFRYLDARMRKAVGQEQGINYCPSIEDYAD